MPTPTLRRLTVAISLAVLYATLSPAPGFAIPKCHRARNIIIMISDGCGYNQIAAADLYRFGRLHAQAYERFPVRLGMSTYSADGAGYDPAAAWSDFAYVMAGGTDSAAAATAMSTGVKTYNSAVGVGVDGQPLTHLLQTAERLHKRTGVVTSVELSHGTPAGFVAHNTSRSNYAAIANEMLLDSATDVIVGCGNPGFDDSGLPAARNPRWVGGVETWSALQAGTAGGDADGDGDADPWTLVQTRAEFQALAHGRPPRRLCGVPQVYTTLQQARAGDSQAAPYVVPRTETVPTLAELSRAALNVLEQGRNGFVLMIEGGAVDWACHSNQAGRLVEEEEEFNAAVEAVLDWLHRSGNWGETLLVVTGDHETGYLTGPGSGAPATWNPLVSNGRGNLPGLQWNSDEHTNSLVPLFAKGFGANLLLLAADERDAVRGRYLDNTELARTCSWLLQTERPGTAGPGALVSGAAAVQTAAGVQVTCTLSADADLSAVVLNLAGRPVRCLASGAAATAGTNTLLWDGRNASGCAVPAGRYLVRLAATGADGTRSQAVVPLTMGR